MRCNDDMRVGTFRMPAFRRCEEMANCRRDGHTFIVTVRIAPALLIQPDSRIGPQPSVRSRIERPALRPDWREIISKLALTTDGDLSAAIEHAERGGILAGIVPFSRTDQGHFPVPDRIEQASEGKDSPHFLINIRDPRHEAVGIVPDRQKLHKFLPPPRYHGGVNSLGVLPDAGRISAIFVG